MPPYIDRLRPQTCLKQLVAAVAMTGTLAMPLAANAAGLGKLTVLSSLGQPLRAEIELTAVSKQEAATLDVKLAPADAFRKANVDLPPVLSSLRFSVAQRQGRHFVRITSTQAINEPFVDLLLQLTGGGTRLIREYTFLLDPPDMRKPQSAQLPAVAPSGAASAETNPNNAAASATDSGDENLEPVASIVEKSAPSALAEELIRNGRSAQPGLTNATSATAEAATVPATAKSRVRAPEKMTQGAKADARAEGASTYRVKEGDTLAAIAGRAKDRSVSLDQMLIALYRANPDAFIDANINRVRAGRVLAIPDAETAAAIDKREAHGMVVAQAEDFNRYRSKLASQVASGSAKKAGDARQSARGKVTARVEEKATTGAARDRLQLSKAVAGDQASSSAAVEEKIAAGKALAEANARVQALEKNLRDLQQLLEIKNKNLAALNEQQQPATTAAAVASAQPAQTEPQPAAAASGDPIAAAAKSAPAVSVDTPAALPEKVAESPPQAAAAPAAIAAPNFFDRLQDNPFAWPGAGAIVALLAAWGIVRMRRKKNDNEAATEEAVADEEGAEEESAGVESEVLAGAAATAAGAVGAAEPAGGVAAVADDSEDPIAEAEMYIAYGRDEQAEDILKLALKTDPQRHAIRAKLLEIYAKREDASGFNDIARALHEATGGVGPEWQQAVVLGSVLDPDNPLYGGSTDGGDAQDATRVVDDETPSKAVAQSQLAEAGPTPAAETETQTETALEQDAGLEFDLSDFKGAEVAPSATSPADIASKIDFDLELDSGAKSDDAALAPVAQSDIDLELPTPVAEPSKPAMPEEDESAFASEMATKLDLAEAYQEIGDKDGARELLEEVVRGGTDSQVKRAKDLLSKLT